jgi:hypothetical protein
MGIRAQALQVLVAAIIGRFIRPGFSQLPWLFIVGIAGLISGK